MDFFSRLLGKPQNQKPMVSFVQLNDGWNAEPNDPDPYVSVAQNQVILSFRLNAFLFRNFQEGDIGRLTFSNCSRFRSGKTNDEGWHRGQCRFSGLAPRWGEFYEVKGDLLLDQSPNDWVLLDSDLAIPRRHFLFYLRDGTFECQAPDWEIEFQSAT